LHKSGEKFKTKSSKKIAKICLEGLDYKDPKHIELIKRFNQKQISADFFIKELDPQNTLGYSSLLKFAEENNISIEGLEDAEKIMLMRREGKEDLNKIDLERSMIMTHRLGEIVKNKKNDEIIIAHSGSSHTNMGSWDLTGYLKNYLNIIQPSGWYIKQNAGKFAMEGDYTFKEYLEKIGFKTASIHLKDIGVISEQNSHVSGYSYNWLNGNDAEKLGEKWKKEWESYKIDHKSPFSINWKDDGENSYFVIETGKIPEISPVLNFFETIKNNHPSFHEVIKNKKCVDYQPYLGHEYDMALVSQTFDSVSAKMGEVNLESGKIKKMYLPEQAGKK